MRWLNVFFGIVIFTFILGDISFASFYTVKPGDSLIRISKKLNFKPSAIKTLNPKIKWLRIRPGQKIAIPSHYLRQTKKEGNVYIVKSGDSLIKISKLLGIKSALMKKYNPRVKWLRIRPGDKIKIPAYVNSEKINKKSSAYIVEKNDYLNNIAKEMNTSMKEIEKLNPNINWAKIRLNNKIKLPHQKVASMQLSKNQLQKGNERKKAISNTVITFKTASRGKKKKFKKAIFRRKKSFTPGEIGNGYYIVKSGDTLSSIARRFGLSLKQLMALNPDKNRLIKPKDLIVLPGVLTQKIMLSKKENLYIPPKYLVYSTPYKIKRGDTLYKIAHKFDTKVYVIKMLNNLGSNNLQAGNYIFVPNKNMVNKSRLELEYSLLRERREALVHYAERFLGRPYRFGGDSLLHGIDCSAFVQKIYERFVRIRIPRTAEEQYRSIGVFVPLSRIQVGDLLFFHTLSYAKVTHVGIYIGRNRFIHAAGRRSGIKISRLSRYYMKRLIGVKRIFSVSNKYVYFRHRSG